jgi:hypothetical protein
MNFVLQVLILIGDYLIKYLKILHPIFYQSIKQKNNAGDFKNSN